MACNKPCLWRWICFGVIPEMPCRSLAWIGARRTSSIRVASPITLKGGRSMRAAWPSR